MLGGGQFLMPVLTYGFNAGALLTQGGWVSFSCLLAGHFLMLVHSDFSGCGADHTKLGGVSCVRKCLAGGASVGHTEWKPQKMVLVEDTDKSVWTVQNPAALKGSEGRHLIITGFLNRKK